MSEEKTDKNIFSLEKILTVSAREYCESRDTRSHADSPPSVADYVFKGVHVQVDPRVCTHIMLVIHAFAGEVPKDAEVVVDYSASVSDCCAVADGTALISKTAYARRKENRDLKF